MTILFGLFKPSVFMGPPGPIVEDARIAAAMKREEVKDLMRKRDIAREVERQEEEELLLIMLYGED